MHPFYWNYLECPDEGSSTQNQTVYNPPGNSGGGNSGGTSTSRSPITGSVVHEIAFDLSPTCTLYGYNGHFIGFCWWEWIIGSIFLMIIIKILHFYRFNIKNLFKQKYEKVL